MRKIKFRAWIKDENKMYYDWGIDSGIGNAFYRKICPETELEKMGRGYDLPKITDWQKEIVFMQYTGLKEDKNSTVEFDRKEIYEGDIIKEDGWDDLYLVEFEDCKFVAIKIRKPNGDIFTRHNKDLDCVLWAVVVGNKYENPELLTP